MAQAVVCFSCQKSIPIVERVGRKEDCPHCGADLHVCRNCEFYDRSAYNECRESSADVVLEKERSNFCDHFSPHQSANGRAAPSKETLRSAAEALFKKS